MSVERRKYYRMPMEHFIEFGEYSFSGDQKKFESKLKDVSEGGILFESDHAPEIGSLIQLKLKIPNWHKHKTEFIKHDWASTPESLVTLGHVMRIEEVEAGNRYEVGVVFECIDDDHRNALAKYIGDLKETAEE